MAAPQSEPATWPGYTSTPSPSSTRRRSERKSPSAPSCASTARSGRAASPTNSESPVSTSHGSSPRERSITANAQCSGRWPGVRMYGHVVLEREPPVSRDVVGVRMRLQHRDEPHPVAPARVQILLDRVGRIDDDGRACMLVTYEIRPTAETVIDKLLEQHGHDASNRCGYES